jgi:hypothetical protein
VRSGSSGADLLLVLEFVQTPFVMTDSPLQQGIEDTAALSIMPALSSDFTRNIVDSAMLDGRNNAMVSLRRTLHFQTTNFARATFAALMQDDRR